MKISNLVFKFDSLIETLKKYDKIAIFGHVHPDGDCYGAAIGLREILKTRFPKKEVKTISSGHPLFFDILNESFEEVSDDFLKKSFAIFVDVNNFNRVEDNRYSLCDDYFIIDHHMVDEPVDENKSIIDTSFIATCELIAYLAYKHNYSLSTVAAHALYLGLVTDSNRFLFSPLNERTFLVASYLLSFGVDTERMYKLLYLKEEKDLVLTGYILSRYKKSSNGVLYFIMKEEELKKLNVKQEEVATRVNLLSNVKGADVFCFIVDGNPVRCEIRSSKRNVRDVARVFGGGGHLHASGCRLANIEEAGRLIEALDGLMKEDE